MSELPAPLTPADCDLQAFQFMPLHVARLRDSDFAAIETPEACWFGVQLWCAAWHQIPAASLPDNDLVLTKLAGLGRDVETWRTHRDGALHGFIKCSDGRLYHPIVAELANQAWESREEFKEKADSKADRQRRWRETLASMGEMLRAAGVTPPRGASKTELIALLDKHGIVHSFTVARDGDETSVETPRGDAKKPATPRGETARETGRDTLRDAVETLRETRGDGGGVFVDNSRDAVETAKRGTGRGRERGIIEEEPPLPPAPIEAPLSPLIRKLMEAGGFASPPNDLGLASKWIELGGDLDTEIIPTMERIRNQIRDRGGRTPFRLKLFDAEVREVIVKAKADVDRLRQSRIDQEAALARQAADDADEETPEQAAARHAEYRAARERGDF